MGQANLLVIAMAERCLNIIQDKPEDKRFALPESLRPLHLRWMCNRIIRHADDWPLARSHRWIGFVQAGMVANYMLDLDAAKSMFRNVKEQFGEADEDLDLLDHLDPSKSFEMDTGGEG